MRQILAMLILCVFVTLPVHAQNPIGETAKSIDDKPLLPLETPSTKSEDKEIARITKLWGSCVSHSPELIYFQQKFGIPAKAIQELISLQAQLGATPCVFASGQSPIDSPYRKIIKMTEPQKDDDESRSKSDLKHPRMSQKEQILLVRTVQTTQDRMMDSYRAYVDAFFQVPKTLGSSTTKVASGVDERTLGQRRQALIDIAGMSAVEELDAELNSKVLSE